jgi:hypothetical protein
VVRAAVVDHKDIIIIGQFAQGFIGEYNKAGDSSCIVISGKENANAWSIIHFNLSLEKLRSHCTGSKTAQSSSLHPHLNCLSPANLTLQLIENLIRRDAVQTVMMRAILHRRVTFKFKTWTARQVVAHDGVRLTERRSTS